MMISTGIETKHLPFFYIRAIIFSQFTEIFDSSSQYILERSALKSKRSNCTSKRRTLT